MEVNGDEPWTARNQKEINRRKISKKITKNVLCIYWAGEGRDWGKLFFLNRFWIFLSFLIVLINFKISPKITQSPPFIHHILFLIDLI